MASSYLTAADRLRRILATNQGAAAELPPPDQPFTRAEVDIDNGTFRQFRHRGVIQKTGQTLVDRNSRHRVGLYETQPTAYRAAQEVASDGPWPDCEHHGFRNLGDGEYTCGADDCEQVYDRGTAAEVFE